MVDSAHSDEVLHSVNSAMWPSSDWPWPRVFVCGESNSQNQIRFSNNVIHRHMQPAAHHFLTEITSNSHRSSLSKEVKMCLKPLDDVCHALHPPQTYQQRTVGGQPGSRGLMICSHPQPPLLSLMTHPPDPVLLHFRMAAGNMGVDAYNSRVPPTADLALFSSPSS